MIEFRVHKHTIRSVDVVEIWRDGHFVGQITPSENGRGIRLISKHYLHVNNTVGSGRPENPDMVFIEIIE